MTLATSRGVGQYVAAEAHTTARGRGWVPNPAIRPIIYFTGSNGNDRDFLDTAASANQIAAKLVDVGLCFFSAQFGSPPYQWASDLAQTRIGQGWTQVKSELGPKPDKFIGIGVSKGAAALLNYARNNPANVAAIIGIVPAVNIADIHDNNRSGLAAEIEAAYGGAAGWAAAAPTHDPAQQTAAMAATGVPVKLIYGNNDTTVLPSIVTNYASAIGATAVSKGAKDHLTTGPAVDPVDDVLKFISAFLT